MTYYSDLSPYEYLEDDPTALNVGWLDREHSFETCELPNQLRSTLHELAVNASTNETRGFHECELCDGDDAASPPLASWGQESRRLGSAEIWITSRGVTYACPDLIVHYVDVHGYCPPLQFIEALRDYRVDSVS